MTTFVVCDYKQKHSLNGNNNKKRSNDSAACRPMSAAATLIKLLSLSRRINKPLLFPHPTRPMLSIANSMTSRLIRSSDLPVDALKLNSATNSMRNGSVISPICALWLCQLHAICQHTVDFTMFASLAWHANIKLRTANN